MSSCRNWSKLFIDLFICLLPPCQAKVKVNGKGFKHSFVIGSLKNSYTKWAATKPTKWSVRPAKTQISLGIHPVWSGSCQCAQWVAEDPMFLHADNKASDQTGQMPRLIWVFAGRKGHVVRFVMRWLKYEHCSSKSCMWWTWLQVFRVA